MKRLALAAAALLLVQACGSGGADPAARSTLPTGEGRTSTTSVPGGDNLTGTTRAPSVEPACSTDQICDLEIEFTEIQLGDENDAVEVTISGETAYVTTSAGAVLFVDLAAGSVTATYQLDAVDLALDGEKLWVLTADGIEQLDLPGGKTGVSGVLAGGVGSHIAVGAGRVWVTTNGTGEVTPFDAGSGDRGDPITDYDNLIAGGTPRLVADDDGVWAIDEQGGRLIRIDPRTMAIVATFDDLGYESRDEGNGLTTILARGPQTVDMSEGSVWVISDLSNPDGEFVSGGAALFQIDPGTNQVSKAMDLIGDPEPGASFVVGADAVWYIEYTSGYLMRVDRESEMQHQVRAGYLTGNGLAASDGMVWMTAGTSLLGLDEDVAAGLVDGTS